MACGATLRRSAKWDALHGPQSPKRRRCDPLAGAASSVAPQRCTFGPPRPAGQQRLTPGRGLPRDYLCYCRSRQSSSTPCPRVSYLQSRSSTASSRCPCPVLHSQRSVCETSDPPTFTLRQVGNLCEQLADEHELKVREEYEEILNSKLSEQYESFVKFTQDLIIQRYGSQPFYVSHFTE
uniref:Akirin 1 n=1 Tax=Paramormyrops kingsleyae TaxID=1676925 RepID=A0A3B3RIC7_9TELE